MMLAYFPELLPDELLFSGIAAIGRHHQEAHAMFIKTATCIRGSTQAFLGLPTNLPSFVESLPICSSLTVDRIERDHTLSPLIQPFLRPETRKNLKQAVAGTIKAARIDCLHKQIVHEDKRLRYCPACYQDDRTRYGRPYWHRCHQVKNVAACSEHRCQLIASSASWLTQSLRASFISAEEITPETDVTPAPSDSTRYASQMRDIVKLNPTCNAWSLRHAALELMRRKDLLHSDRSINWAQLRILVHECFSKEEQGRYESDARFLAKQWSALTSSSTRSWLKPHQFFVLTHAIGHEVKDLIILAGAQQWETGPWECKNTAAPCNGIQTIERFSLEQNGCARFTCPTCLGSYHRSLPLVREPNGSFRYDVTIDSKGWRAELPAIWHDLTLSLEDIAERLGKSCAEIRSNAIALRLGNRRTCKRAGILTGRASVDSTALMTRRSTWLRLVADNPGLSKTHLVKTNPGLGEWLYRNDSQWFSKQTPLYEKRKRQCSVNYHERDVIFAASVPSLAQDILKEDPPVPISFCALSRRLKLTMAKARIRQIYPLTASAIADAISNQPEFIERSLISITKVWRERERVPTWHEFISTRALFARRCTKDGEFRHRVLDYYQNTWPENPNYLAGSLKPINRQSFTPRNLPPEKRLEKCIYPFGQLAIGGSFFVPLGEKNADAIRNAVIRSMHHYKSQGLLPKHFRLKATNETEKSITGVRFMRISAHQKLTVAISFNSSEPPPKTCPAILLPKDQMAICNSFFLTHWGG